MKLAPTSQGVDSEAALAYAMAGDTARAASLAQDLGKQGLARAYALEAKTSQGADADAARLKALTAYKDFLTLRRDADPDIPILVAAKSEYAKLK